ncbi:MAG: 3-dehydroquinate synthase [Marinilabiliaceae bacterium]|nr:3-dehydroquinate synthase [Marinilabiliaceae bacterium]
MVRLDFNLSEVYIVENLKSDLAGLLNSFQKDKIFVLTDDNSYKYCYPKIKGIDGICDERTFVITAGDDHKNIDVVVELWKKLSNGGADRKSVLINLGGGMPTDLGGFVASTFKRGLKFINIPTTLLSQVDASVGGKTGINFEGFKNEIGVFNIAHAVLIDTSFLDTLDSGNLISGFAEMIKHTLIFSEKSWLELKSFNLKNPNLEGLKKLVADSIAIKEHFVEADPTEKGIRKALNFGHTIGHAIESFALKSGRPLLHGYAVAYGMIAELYLSHLKLGFPLDEVKSISESILSIYGSFAIDKSTDDIIYELTTHDKKNEGGRINVTLLDKPGSVQIDIVCSKEDIIASMDFYRSIK